MSHFTVTNHGEELALLPCDWGTRTGHSLQEVEPMEPLLQAQHCLLEGVLTTHLQDRGLVNLPLKYLQAKEQTTGETAILLFLFV